MGCVGAPSHSIGTRMSPRLVGPTENTVFGGGEFGSE